MTPDEQCSIFAHGLLNSRTRITPTVDLGEKLANCSPRARCMSGACPVCVDLHSKSLVQALQNGLTEEPIVFTTIVAARSATAIGDLHRFNPALTARQIRYATSKIGFYRAFFLLDATLNEHKTGRYEPFWCMHYHGLVAGIRPDVLKEQLKAQYPATDAIPRPISTTEWDGNPDALAYLLTSNFDRRIARDDGIRFDKRTGEPRFCRVTDPDRIQTERMEELLLFLDRIGIRGRFVPVYCRLYGDAARGYRIGC
jgi:hypothetical protein